MMFVWKDRKQTIKEVGFGPFKKNFASISLSSQDGATEEQNRCCPVARIVLYSSISFELLLATLLHVIVL